MRGFTLIELMVVVMIIAISAALAIPSIMNVVRDRKVQKSAAQVFGTVSDARGRSFGRGSGIRLTWNAAVNGGVLTMSEAVRDVDGAGGPDVPEPLCWAVGTPAVTEQPITFWQRDKSDGDVIVSVVTDAFEYPNAAPTDVEATLDLCFTPRGLLYKRVTGNWQRTTLVHSWRFQHAINDVPANPFIGGRGDFSRFVHLAPSGVARLTL